MNESLKAQLSVIQHDYDRLKRIFERAVSESGMDVGSKANAHKVLAEFQVHCVTFIANSKDNPVT